MRKDRARQYRKFAMAAAQGLPASVAAEMPGLYPEWQTGTAYGGDNLIKIVSYQGQLYICTQAHTSQANWTPQATPAMWAAIDVTHAGTQADPIPAALGMQYYEGKYYSEAGAIYRCTRDSGMPLSYLPSQLIGQYFVLV
jgi:hypothetical protein